MIGMNGGVCSRQWLGHSPWDEPLTLTRCCRYGVPQLNESLGTGGLSMVKPAT